MNKDRRKALDALATQIGELFSKAADLQSELESLRDEEQDYFDNMPESLQGGEKGEAAEAAIEAMESVIDALSELQGVDVDGLADL